MDQLAAVALIGPETATGTHLGYQFTIEVKKSSERVSAAYQAVGVPVTYGKTGRRSFFMDESGVIRGGDNRGAEATALSAPLYNVGYLPSAPPAVLKDVSEY